MMFEADRFGCSVTGCDARLAVRRGATIAEIQQGQWRVAADGRMLCPDHRDDYAKRQPASNPALTFRCASSAPTE